MMEGVGFVLPVKHPHVRPSPSVGHGLESSEAGEASAHQLLSPLVCHQDVLAFPLQAQPCRQAPFTQDSSGGYQGLASPLSGGVGTGCAAADDSAASDLTAAFYRTVLSTCRTLRPPACRTATPGTSTPVHPSPPSGLHVTSGHSLVFLVVTCCWDY
ncbi:hypothetical protein ACOMHN_009521 [Nucella lapillus]